jgi:hypothetical protein
MFQASDHNPDAIIMMPFCGAEVFAISPLQLKNAVKE